MVRNKNIKFHKSSDSVVSILELAPKLARIPTPTGRYDPTNRTTTSAPTPVDLTTPATHKGIQSFVLQRHFYLRVLCGMYFTILRILFSF